MNQEKQTVVLIRKYRSSDQSECSKLIIEGVMSTVRPSFLSALTREVTFQIIITMAATMFVFIGLSPTLCLLAIPVTIFFIYLCVYLSHLKKASSLANEAANIEKNFLSSKYTCFWVAEVYEPIHPIKAFQQKNYVFLKENDLPTNLLDDNIFSKKIVGIAGINRCNIIYKSAWLRRMVISKKYQRRGVGTALLSQAIDFCQTRGYESVELVTSECQDGARTLYLQKGFKLRQLYHKSIFGTLIQVLMYQFTLALNQNANVEKKTD